MILYANIMILYCKSWYFKQSFVVIGVHTTQMNWRMLWTILKLIKAMAIELLCREIHLKKSFAAIPPDSLFINFGKVIFRPRECVRSQVPNKMAKQSETSTKSVGKQLFGGDHDDYNKCVFCFGQGRVWNLKAFLRHSNEKFGLHFYDCAVNYDIL